MEKRKALYGTLSPLRKKETGYLQPYFYQGGKWYKLNGEKPVKNKILIGGNTVSSLIGISIGIVALSFLDFPTWLMVGSAIMSVYVAGLVLKAAR